MADRQTDASKLKSNTFGKTQGHNEGNIENVNVLTISMHWYMQLQVVKLRMGGTNSKMLGIHGQLFHKSLDEKIDFVVNS